MAKHNRRHNLGDCFGPIRLLKMVNWKHGEMMIENNTFRLQFRCQLRHVQARQLMLIKTKHVS